MGDWAASVPACTVGELVSTFEHLGFTRMDPHEDDSDYTHSEPWVRHLGDEAPVTLVLPTSDTPAERDARLPRGTVLNYTRLAKVNLSEFVAAFNTLQ